MGASTWVVGVTLAAVASVLSNLGLNLQKLTHMNLQKASEEEKRLYFKKRLWMLGLGLIIAGSVADFLALGFAAQSIIAPLGSLTLVSNVIFAPWLLNEEASRRDIGATGIIILGSSLSVAFASHEDTTYTVSQLFSFFSSPRFGAYVLTIIGAMLCMWSVVQHCERLRELHGNGGEYGPWRKIHRFCYGSLAGTVGAQSVLFAKCTAELLVNTLSGGGFMFMYIQSYLVIMGMCSTIFLQIKWLNQGLAMFDALVIVPVFQSFWILVSVIAGLVFFGEYREMSRQSVYMFPMGILLTIYGVFVLSQRGVGPNGASPDDVDEGYMRVVQVDEVDIEDGQDRQSHHRSPSPRTPDTPPVHYDNREIDESIGFQGRGVPATFTPSMMARMSHTFTPARKQPVKNLANPATSSPGLARPGTVTMSRRGSHPPRPPGTMPPAAPASHARTHSSQATRRPSSSDEDLATDTLISR